MNVKEQPLLSLFLLTFRRIRELCCVGFLITLTHVKQTGFLLKLEHTVAKFLRFSSTLHAASRFARVIFQANIIQNLWTIYICLTLSFSYSSDNGQYHCTYFVSSLHVILLILQLALFILETYYSSRTNFGKLSSFR